MALVDPDFPREPSSRRALVHATVVGTLLVPFGNGLVGLGTVGAAVVLALLILGPLLAADWLAGTADADAVSDDGALRELLPGLPVAQLLQEWQATDDLLSSSQHHLLAAEVRALLLDELSRRDPEGVAEWLAAGDASPLSYIRPGRDLAG